MVLYAYGVGSVLAGKDTRKLGHLGLLCRGNGVCFFQLQ